MDKRQRGPLSARHDACYVLKHRSLAGSSRGGWLASPGQGLGSVSLTSIFPDAQQRAGTGKAPTSEKLRVEDRHSKNQTETTTETSRLPSCLLCAGNFWRWGRLLPLTVDVNVPGALLRCRRLSALEAEPCLHTKQESWGASPPPAPLTAVFCSAKLPRRFCTQSPQRSSAVRGGFLSHPALLFDSCSHRPD